MCETTSDRNSLTSLDATETSSHAPPSEQCDDPSPLISDNAQQRRAHARDLWRRQKIVECLHHGGGPDERRAASTIAGCCRYPVIAALQDGSLRVCMMRCRHRLCPTCGRLRCHRVSEAITEAVKRMNAPRLITLTQIADDSTWKRKYSELMDAFRRLRTRSAWKTRVTSGIYAVETTFNASTQRWHVHVHVVVDGEFFPQKLLSDEWFAASNGSKIVDIRAIHDRSKAAAYVAKYVGKPAQPEAWPSDRICEYARDSRGVRTWHTFGKLHGARLRDELPSDHADVKEVLCGTQRLLAAARRGDSNARKACVLLSKLGPTAAKALGVEVTEALLWYRPLETHEVAFVVEQCAIAFARHVHAQPKPSASTMAKHNARLQRLRQLHLYAQPP